MGQYAPQLSIAAPGDQEQEIGDPAQQDTSTHSFERHALWPAVDLPVERYRSFSVAIGSVRDLRMSTRVEVIEAIPRSASRREIEREDVLAPEDLAGVGEAVAEVERAW
jgi:hypothetical protein